MLTRSQIAAIQRAYDALASIREQEHKALGLLGGRLVPSQDHIAEIDFILGELARIEKIDRPAKRKGN